MPPPRYGKASKASKKEEKKPSGPSQAELLAKAREAQIAERDRVRKEREAAAQQRREAGKNKKPGAGSRQSIRDLKKEHAAKKEAEAAALGTDGRSWKAMTKSKARLAARRAWPSSWTTTSEREKYTSFCAHIAATEMEVWVEEVFAGVDLCRNQPVAWPCVDTDADGEITLYDFELLEGREGSSSVRRLFEVVDCIDQDGSITMQEWVQFLANLWHFGGDDLDRYTEAASIGLYERMDAVFEGMDFDGNGTIEKEELAELIQDDEVSAEIMPLLDNIDEDDTITKEEFRLFFDLMGKGVGETGVEACLITFENLLRLRGNKMSEAYELKRKESMQKASGGAAVPALQGVRPQLQSLPTPIGEASAAALKAALGSARSSVNPTPRSSSTPRTAHARRMFARSNAGSMYTPFHARSSPRHKKKAADKADAKAGS
ncbi:hypothetical protein JL720_16939 [Aureococcus anophagefferens]|nr:hypothetical protein JL720_16939 [Aureococcus anophagefferens]